MIWMLWIPVVLFALPLAGALFGAFSGWVVGLFFADVVLGFLGRVGVDTAALEMWQVGMALGFLGGFFKTNVSKDSK